MNILKLVYRARTNYYQKMLMGLVQAHQNSGIEEETQLLNNFANKFYISDEEFGHIESLVEVRSSNNDTSILLKRKDRKKSMIALVKVAIIDNTITHSELLVIGGIGRELGYDHQTVEEIITSIKSKAMLGHRNKDTFRMVHYILDEN